MKNIILAYKNIRKANPYTFWKSQFVGFFICIRISPITTFLFIKNHIKPNTVTLLMIISGIVGAGFFSLPNIGCKILGVFFIYLWFIFDCSDGEVARMTKTFSIFGKEFDLIAHITNHPLFILAFLASLIQIDRYNLNLLFILAIVLISSELILRNMISLDIICNFKMKEQKQTSKKSQNLIIKIIKYMYANSVLFPNFALLFPVCFIIDYYFRTDIGYYYLIITSISYVFTVIKLISRKIILFLNS